MAHVLLPCDLPIWNDIQRHLAQLKVSKDADHLIQGMSKIYELCSISLEPEEGNKLQGRREEAGSRFNELKLFLEERLLIDERNIFFSETLPNLVSQALCLRLAKPSTGFFYSLKRETETFELDRVFVKSLLANAFFSTFPKRTPNTHPFLQNFAFSDFFRHLHRRSHQKKLKAFFRYFQKTDPKEIGPVCFTRKVLSGGQVPSLPAWLCSDRPLVPLLVRHEGNIHDADPCVCRVFSCSPLIGGDVLEAATSPESSLFFAFPELMCCLSFVEKLEDNEAFLAIGVSPRGIHKNHRIAEQEVNMCFMDSLDLGSESDRQFEDRNLLRELNKALTAFSQNLGGRDSGLVEQQRRQTPVGESSSSEQQSSASSRRASVHDQQQMKDVVDLTRRRNSQESTKLASKSSRKKSNSYLPLIDTDDSTTGITARTLSRENSGSCCNNNNNSSSSIPGEFPKLRGKSTTSPLLECLRGSTSSSRSSSKSMRTASESSLELPPIQQQQSYSGQPSQRDEEYYTADEDSEQGSECGSKVRRRRRRSSTSNSKSCDLTTLLKSTSGLVSSELVGFSSSAAGMTSSNKGKGMIIPMKSSTGSSSKDSSSGLSISSGRTSPSSRRSASAGFVLGGTGSDDELDGFPLEEEDSEQQQQHSEHGPPIHERLEDFRKRICRRTRRHLSRKMRNSLRSSYSLGSSTSSDMEDISEEEVEDSYDLHQQHHHQILRPATSEPSLVSPNDLGSQYSYDSEEDNWKNQEFSPTELPFLPPVSQWMDRKYSAPQNTYELISRRSSTTSDKRPAVVGPAREGDPQLRALVLWLAASMAQLPALIFYTGSENLLHELGTVYRRVLSQQWTVGDLSCEVLRFCRNKLSPRQRSCTTFLFEQLLSTGAVSLTSSSRSYSQYSLD